MGFEFILNGFNLCGKFVGHLAEFCQFSEFGYDFSRTCDEIRPDYHHVESCQETVPEAITAFLEGNDFEDVIRTAVSLGGDCDTLTCIAGSITEAYYGVLDELKKECEDRLPADLKEALQTCLNYNTNLL
jgi:ADP-ribosylglycohydrolase